MGNTQMTDSIFEGRQTTGKHSMPLKDKLVTNRRVYDLEFLQENFQIQNTDKTLDNTPTENHVTHQPSPWRQILEVSRQKESAASSYMPETKHTFLQSHEQGK
jgi:hypothetical protein